MTGMASPTNKIPKDAVLLIPEPDDESDQPAYGVAPGYYNPEQMLALLDQHKDNADAIHFIADMLESGDEESDGFARLLRAHHDNPAEIGRIVKSAQSS
jgi:hypothetical protein